MTETLADLETDWKSKLAQREAHLQGLLVEERAAKEDVRQEVAKLAESETRLESLLAEERDAKEEAELAVAETEIAKDEAVLELEADWKTKYAQRESHLQVRYGAHLTGFAVSAENSAFVPIAVRFSGRWSGLQDLFAEERNAKEEAELEVEEAEIGKDEVRLPTTVSCAFLVAISRRRYTLW